MKINYNDYKKPMQPNDITLAGLYDKAGYSSIVFDYVLQLLGKKFKQQTGLDCYVNVGPLKGGERAVEKLANELDLKKNPSNILDILRATVTVKDVETLLEFINFTKNVTFQYKDFKQSSLDKATLKDIENRLRTNVVDTKKNIDIVNVCMDAVKKSEGKDDGYKAEIEKEKSKDIETISKNFKLLESDVDTETKLWFENFNIFLREPKNLPIANVATSNGFSLDANDEVKQKYPFLKNEPKVKDSNYMDFKFYVCIPTPYLENEYMICEVIATLDCFDKVYPKTHILYELSRKEFQEKPWDDMSKEDFKLVLDMLRREKYIEVITEYNKAHPNSIHILPYKDDAELRKETFEKVGNSITYTTAVLGCRDLVIKMKEAMR